jgi:putative ABC transport system substrate-binding protein
MRAVTIHKALISIALCATLLATNSLAEAQQPSKLLRIGFLGATSAVSVGDRTQALRKGLADLGYVEGKNIVIEWRYADGKPGELTSLAAELVQQKVDLLITQGSSSTRAAQRATRSVPIVMTASADPVGEGMIASFARPGGNITGLTIQAPELSGKRLELLKEIVPRASRVAVLLDPTNVGISARRMEIENAARAFAIRLQAVEVRAREDIERAFAAARKESAEALIVFRVAVFTTYRDRVVQLATHNKIPAIYEVKQFVEAGGLMSYSADEADNYRRAATYVDKILKGANPADLPVEQPTKFELVINLKTAKQIGLTIPQSVLYRADKVVK